MALKMLLVYFTEEKSRFLTKEWTKCAYVCACVIFLRYSGAESTAVCLQIWKRLHTKYSAQRKRSTGSFSILDTHLGLDVRQLVTCSVSINPDVF